MKKIEVEDSILEVTQEFRKGTFNFQWEVDFHNLLFCTLLSKIKKYYCKGQMITRLHAEFPTHSKITEKGRHDLVILDIPSAKTFQENYGENIGKWRDRITFEYIFEIKFLYKNLYLPSNQGIVRDLRRLTKIRNNKKLISKHCYMLIFIDKDVDWDNDRYEETKKYLEKQSQIPDLSIYCVPGKSGDIIIFKSGRCKRIT